VAAVTLHDVATRAGVSIKTVSNVVRGVASKASPETARRVREAIDELGYRPNLSARRLRSGRSQVIALALPDLRNPYFAEVAAAVIACARARDYTVFIEETGGDAAAELDAAEGLSDPMIDGVILSPLLLDQKQLTARGNSVPLVLLGERQYESPCDHVMFDNVEASQRITQHLIDQGFRRIAVIGHQKDPPHATAVKRLTGYRQALRGARIAYDKTLAPAVSGAPYGRAAGAAAMTQLMTLPEIPEAVYCFADILAFGALYAANAAGLRVPGDVALASFDGLEEARFSVPTLTTIAPDLTAMASIAVSALIERINATTVLPHRQMSCPYDLIIGQSSQRAPVKRSPRTKTVATLAR